MELGTVPLHACTHPDTAIERYVVLQSMTLAEAEKVALQILKQVMEEKISSTNVELATVRSDTRQFKFHTCEQLEAIINDLNDGPL